MRNFTLITLFALALSGCNQQKNNQTTFKTQNVLNEFKDSVPDFGIVALIDNGKFLDTASIGFAFSKNAVSTKNRFCIGSCTKMFTSVTVLKLHEKGLLNINDQIYKYLPKHLFIDSSITIRQLLNHTSGLTEILKNGFQNEPIIHPDGDFSDKVIFSKIDTIDFEKGSRYSYCNTNYFLLAKIIERATDKSWEMNIQEQIIQPLQLKNTFPYHSNTITNLAHPIIDGQDLHKIPKSANNKLSQGSGNIVSDLFDLNTFIRALLINKTLLTKNSLDLMTGFYEYKNTKSGLGLFEDKYGKRVLLGHTGLQISYISYVFADPKTGESIIVLNNNAKDVIIDKVFEKLCLDN
ncbi:MAG: beta-lactamase family protein [Bacteroidia bacterium]|nr:beta-lactamase family protein [Bacteroidia bacterium]